MGIFGGEMPGEIRPYIAEEALGKHAIGRGELRCPTCGSRRLRRQERKGFLQKRVYSFLGFYPWRCGTCKTNFYMRRRSITKGTKEKKYKKYNK